MTDRLLPANTEAIKKKIREQIDQPEPQLEWRIDGIPGLMLMTRPSGKAAWHFVYRAQTGGKQRKPKIGTFPTMPLAEARAKVAELRLQVEKGGDPALDRAVEKAAMTFKELAEKFLAEGDLAPSTRQTYTWTYKKDVYPFIGDKPAGSVTKEFIHTICNAVAGRKTTRQQQATKTAIGGAYKWGIERGYVKTNPTRDVPNQQKGESKRSRVPTDDELAALWKTPDKTRMTTAMKCIIRLSILTGQRRTQIAETRAVELKDLDGANPRWVIPPRSKKLNRGSRTKNEGAQIVYLSKQAASLYSKAMKECRVGDYVFPADTDRTKDGKTRKPHIHGESVTKAVGRAREDDAMKAAKKAAAEEIGADEIEAITIHDMRRAISSYLGDEGVQEIVVKMILHHARNDVTGRHYDKAKREKQLRDAWQIWADHVEKIVSAPPSRPLGSADADAAQKIDDDARKAAADATLRAGILAS